MLVFLKVGRTYPYDGLKLEMTGKDDSELPVRTFQESSIAVSL